MTNDPVKTYVNEGLDFLKRLYGDDVVNTYGPPQPKVSESEVAAATFAAHAWAAMRAIYECPNCTEKYRIPVGDRLSCEHNSVEDVLYCEACGGFWVHQDAHEEIRAKFSEKGG